MHGPQVCFAPVVRPVKAKQVVITFVAISLHGYVVVKE